MKILVTGASSLVGSHFVENYTLNVKDNIILTPSAEEMDITDKNSVENFCLVHRPDTIIHFAAFTDVLKAEDQRNNRAAPCWMINVGGTANLINSVNNQSYFIYVSTDVVFSGHKDNPGPYAEDSPSEENSDLLSWYGWTKREAEQLVIKNFEKSLILRISNPTRAKYAGKLDYVRKIINLYDINKLYPMFNDQYLTLTFIDEVTQTLKIILEKKCSGIYHVSSANLFTPYKLANYLIEKIGGKKESVKSISIKAFLKDNPSRYPQYGGLKVDKTQQELSLKFRTWEEIVDSLVKQLSI